MIRNRLLSRIPIICLILLLNCSLMLPFSTRKVSAGRFDDYWEKEAPSQRGWDENGGVYNVFLRTDNLLMKTGVFVVWIIVAYLLSWLIFRAIIEKNKSPARTFTHCFLCYMLSFYIAAFLCFSEYALVQKYDEGISYLSQLNWTVILIILGVWAVISFILTFTLRGK